MNASFFCRRVKQRYARGRLVKRNRHTRYPAAGTNVKHAFSRKVKLLENRQRV